MHGTFYVLSGITWSVRVNVVFMTLRHISFSRSPAAEPITGVPAYTIVKLAYRLATAKPAMIIPGFGPQRHANGEQETRGIAALACITGNVGKSGGGFVDMGVWKRKINYIWARLNKALYLSFKK